MYKLLTLFFSVHRTISAIGNISTKNEFFGPILAHKYSYVLLDGRFPNDTQLLLYAIKGVPYVPDPILAEEALFIPAIKNFSCASLNLKMLLKVIIQRLYSPG